MKRLGRRRIAMIVLALSLVTVCAIEQPSEKPVHTMVPTVVEPGLAYGIPCRPPCWRGLVPGQSTREEVERAIEQVDAEEWAYHIIDGGSVGGGYSVLPSAFTSRGTIHVVMENDTVARICGSTLFYYSIGDLVRQFGDPQGLYLSFGQGSKFCRSCEDWIPSPYNPTASSEMSAPVHLLYPDQGLWFLGLVPQSGMGCICPEMKVTVFCYYSPRSVQEALGDEHLTIRFGALTEDDLMDWHGFGGGY